MITWIGCVLLIYHTEKHHLYMVSGFRYPHGPKSSVVRVNSFWQGHFLDQLLRKKATLLGRPGPHPAARHRGLHTTGSKGLINASWVVGEGEEHGIQTSNSRHLSAGDGSGVGVGGGAGPTRQSWAHLYTLNRLWKETPG